MVDLAGKEASGWVVRLPGLYAPLVFNTLMGLVAYHPRDNSFDPYGRIMRFILRYYDVRAKLRRGDTITARRRGVRQRRMPMREVA